MISPSLELVALDLSKAGTSVVRKKGGPEGARPEVRLV
jgi:hypothetical protein